MRILFLGDVMGRAGRDAVAEKLPELRTRWKLDFVVVNAENATSGVGLSGAHAKSLLEAGADVNTTNEKVYGGKKAIDLCSKDEIKQLLMAKM